MYLAYLIIKLSSFLYLHDQRITIADTLSLLRQSITKFIKKNFSIKLNKNQSEAINILFTSSSITELFMLAVDPSYLLTLFIVYLYKTINNYPHNIDNI